MPPAAGCTVVEELFCSGKVLYFHQPVGMIVADKSWTAIQAAKKVKIYYSDPMSKPLLNVPDVLNAKATDRITPQTTVVAKTKG